MKEQTAATRTVATTYSHKESVTPTTKRARVPKKAICLSYLYQHSLVELEALSLYGETCLHSTISALANNNGLEFKRVRESHSHQHGGTVYFTRYTLADESRKAAAALLRHYGIEVEEIAA